MPSACSGARTEYGAPGARPAGAARLAADPAICLLCCAVLGSVLATGCSGGSPAAHSAAVPAAPPAATGADADKVINVYNWGTYMDPEVLRAFEQEFGIKVNYDVYDSNEILETKLFVGHTNYDVVVPSGY